MEKVQQLVSELNNALGTLDFVKKSIINNLNPILDALAQDIQNMQKKINDLQKEVDSLKPKQEKVEQKT